MRHYAQSPRYITARFASTCPETGKPIRKGDDCLYYPDSRKAYHVDSKTARDWNDCQFDANVLGMEY